MTHARWLVFVLLAVTLTACTRSVPPAMPAVPAFPEVPALPVPATVVASPQARERHEAAWRRFQTRDLRGAARDWQAALAEDAAFYPAAAGLGFIALEERRWPDALRLFREVLTQDADYVPALAGHVDAALELDDAPAAAGSLERLVALTPAGPERDEREARLDVLRLRAVQDAMAEAATHRDAGRLADAQRALDRARQLAPGSPGLLQAQARLDVQRGAFDEAERHAREAIAADPQDADGHAVLGEVLEAQGRLAEASAAYQRAVDRDPRAEWRSRVASLASAAELALLPADYKSLPSASVVTRAQIAALLGIRLEGPLAAAPRRATVVLTDVRRHWAAPWILPVVRAGVMEALPDHSFQPSGVVRRADLAQIAWRGLQVLASHRPEELQRWAAARQAATDVPRTHLAYTAVAAVLAAGAMSVDEDGRFRPGQPVSGAEAIAVVARLEQAAGGRR